MPGGRNRIRRYAVERTPDNARWTTGFGSIALMYAVRGERWQLAEILASWSELVTNAILPRIRRFTIPVAVSAAENRTENLGGLTVSPGDGVGVHIECRGGTGVAEALRHRGDGNAGGQHLRGHEVAQIV